VESDAFEITPDLSAALALMSPDQREWLACQFEALTTEMEVLTPSEWAERKRYLPPQVTGMPGYYRFSVNPFMREIVDCLSVDSPIRELTLMKGVQITATTGVLENSIGYFIEHVKTAPMMMITADAELAKLRMDSHVVPMLQNSGLDHLIRSGDEKNTRKTGRTDKKIEWMGGGYLVPFGAQNANKLRSLPIQILLRDEIDAWPDTVGKDGDPIKLSTDRTSSYESSRKILDISTPLIKGMSKITARFMRGDRRYYYVCCLGCGHPQTLRWRREDEKTGEVSGIVWETENGHLVHDSVRYICEKCQHAHTNDDKTRLLSPDYGAEWRPTAEPVNPTVRSYHLSALYSPVGMKTWADCVQGWLEAWDESNNRPRDLGLLQVFYNNILGEPYELRGEKLRFETVSPHRRAEYRFGQVPNKFAREHCGGPIHLVTCAVDVHKDNLAVAVFGWCRDRRAVLLDYFKLEGDTEHLSDLDTWVKLVDFLGSQVYEADDGRKYGIALTLVDSGYRTEQVYELAGQFDAGIFPVKGREYPPKAAHIKEFSEFTTPLGTRAFSITVDLYKDRWSAALRRQWPGQGMQPVGHFNAPLDITDKQLKELTVEVKREKIEKSTGKRVGFEWHRPSGAANELWDLLVYNNTALDIIAWDLCRNQMEAESVSWLFFWDYCETHAPFVAQ
jgi:terminase, large subunit